jgi:hypothetical protein
MNGDRLQHLVRVFERFCENDYQNYLELEEHPTENRGPHKSRKVFIGSISFGACIVAFNFRRLGPPRTP